MAATRTARTAVEALGRSAVLATRQAAKAKRVEEAATALKDSAPEKAFQITLRRSKIGLPETHRRVFKALGVRKLHQSVLRTATPAIAGMLLKVKECVEVRVVDKTQLPTAREAQLRKKHAKRAEQAKVVEDTKVEIAKLVEQARPAIKKGKIGTVAAALSKVTPKRST